METNKVYNNDCMIVMKKIERDCIDLIVTSPPYNLAVKYDEYNDSKPIEEYKKWVQALCKEIYRVTKDGGRVCINVPLITKDFESGKRISADQLYQNILDEVGLEFREKIIWNKKGVSKRNAWGSYMLPSCPWIVYPTEVILVYEKGTSKIRVNRELATISKELYKKCTYDIWWVEIEGEHSKKHPAVFPKEIPRRLIEFYTYKNDIVLDPLMGIGTTCIVAKELERKYIGIEMSENYFNIACELLDVKE